MNKRLATMGIIISVSLVGLLIIIVLGYIFRKQQRQAKAREEKGQKFIRHRPSPLKLPDHVRVKRLPSQLSPQPLFITPTTPNQFTIPPRSHFENQCKSTLLSSSPDLALSPLVSQQLGDASPKESKYFRAMSEGYGFGSPGTPQTPHGQIEYFLRHDCEKSCLIVQILGKKGHSLSWLTGISNPYIRISVISRDHTECNGGPSSQILNLSLSTKCQLDGITKEDVKDCLLKFVVFDFDRFSRSEFVAEVLVSLGELEYLSEGVTVCEDLIRQQKVMLAPRGSLLVSLCNQAVGQQLQVIIMKAHDIPSKSTVSLTGSDLCVRTTLETAQVCYKRKTKGVRKNSSYIFNERLVFDVSSDDLTNASLVFEVSRGDLKLLHETKIGFVKLGLDSSLALEIRHWSEMLTSPQKQIAEWHQLHR